MGLVLTYLGPGPDWPGRALALAGLALVDTWLWLALPRLVCTDWTWFDLAGTVRALTLDSGLAWQQLTGS